MTQPPRKIALARSLRKAMTEPERLLWARLKSRANGLVFKRQQAIGPYVLDFFCYQAQLAVEVDGHHHGTQGAEARDTARDRYFATLGIVTYRVPAADVYRYADAVADGIWLHAHEIVDAARQDTPPPFRPFMPDQP